MNNFSTPLRYPGGKGRLGDWLGETLRHNGLSGGTYVEPYAGGAGAAIHLLTRGYVERLILNDIDPAIFAFWYSVLSETDAFVKRIETSAVDMKEWHRNREIISSPSLHSTLDLGFAAFFLNRTNRSGILSAGVIGGKAQAGKWKLDARFNRGELADRVRRIGHYRRRITVRNVDAMTFVNDVGPDLPSKSLIYFDPPYYEKGSLLYENHYKPKDHAAIAKHVKRVKTPWLVTYDNCSEIRDLYRWAPAAEFSMKYSTHTSRPTGTEVMFYRNLALPSAPALKR